jgi:type IV fimbrial biogenesis protein FimT
MDRTAQHGFTLYELLVTVVVMGIILSLGVPNFLEFTRNNRMAATSNDLLAAFTLARTEAVKRKSPVTVCSSLNPLADPPACGGTFADGWVVFADDDGDIAIDAGEEVIRSVDAVPDGITLQTNGGSNYFSYAGTGFTRGDVGGAPALRGALLCDARGNVPAAGGLSAARALRMDGPGRPQVVREVALVQNVADILVGAGCP